MKRSIILKNTDCMKGTLSNTETKEGVLNCAWAEVQANTPRFIVTAMQEAICGNNTYQEIPKSFYNSIMKVYEESYNFYLQRENIELSPGIITGIALLIKEYTKEQDKVGTFFCEYPNIHRVIKNSGRICEPIHLKKDLQGRYSIDWNELEKKIKNVKMLIFSNPHNPTGMILNKDELSKINKLASENNVFVITDECHKDFVWGEKFISYITVSRGENSATFISPGKTYSLSGLSTGVIIADKEIITQFNKQFDFLHLVKNKIAATAIETAYTNVQSYEYVVKLKKEILSNKKYFIKCIKSKMPEINVVEINSLFTVWFDCSKWNMKSSDIRDGLLNKGLMITSGEGFGEPNGSMRINLAIPRHIVEKAIKIIIEFRNENYN